MPKFRFWFEGVVDAPDETRAKYFVATLGQTDLDERDCKLVHGETKIEVSQEDPEEVTV